ncbi:hypothetical protein D3C81_1018240 [compost metagenome]
MIVIRKSIMMYKKVCRRVNNEAANKEGTFAATGFIPGICYFGSNSGSCDLKCSGWAGSKFFDLLLLQLVEPFF